MKYDIITIGGTTEDLFIYTKEGVLINNKKDLLRQKLLAFEYGAKIQVDQAETSFGGGASNAAIAFSRLGLKTAAMVAVGTDQRGSEIIANFKKNRVSTKLVQKIKGQMTGFSAIVVGGDKEHVAFPVRGANHFLKIGKKEKLELSKSKWQYIASLSGKWQETLDEIFSNGGKSKIAWNPGQVQLLAGKKVLEKYLRNTEVLIVNLDEARELIVSDKKFSKKPRTFFNNSKELAKVICSWGVGMAVVTDGEKGSVVFDGNKFYSYKPEKIKEVLNTVGVGDSFGSSFIAGLEIYNGDVDKALNLAGINSARVVRSHSAQIGLITKTQLHEQQKKY